MKHLPTARIYTARYALRVLEAKNWNKRAACKILDIAYHTLDGCLDDLGVPRQRPAQDIEVEDADVEAIFYQMEQAARLEAATEALAVMREAVEGVPV